MNNLSEKLLELKEKIEQAEKEKYRLEGEIESLTSALKEMGFDTIAKAEDKSKELENEINDLTQKTEKEIDTITEQIKQYN